MSNTTSNNDIEKINEKYHYINNPDFKFEQTIYLVLCIIFNVVAVISLIFFYKLRNSYMIRQRNFGLTFICGVLTYISVTISFIPQFSKTTCLLNVFQANILNTIVMCIFFSRSLRVVLFYRYNIFKVTSIKKKRLHGSYNKSLEPNYYLPRITRKINKIILFVIIVPTSIALVYIVVRYFTKEEIRNSCRPFELKDAIQALRDQNVQSLFKIIAVYSFIYIFLSVINAITLIFYVKDANKYGVKFECLTVSIMLFIACIGNMVLQRNANLTTAGKNNSKYSDILENIFDKTKGGRMLFTFVSTYMFLVSITLPVFQYYRAKKVKNEYFQDPMSSIQYFYKVLNTPTLVSELRDIAIQEFSVENVLFWENYQILQTMAYRYQVELKKAQDMGDARMVSQYDFEGYYQKQVQSFSVSSMDDYSYDPDMPVPKELMPYYTSFYYMFIDFNGPAVVNLMSSTVKRIFSEISICPTIGMYDMAKNEIVELMYSSIYPILLRKNKKHMANTLG